MACDPKGVLGTNGKSVPSLVTDSQYCRNFSYVVDLRGISLVSVGLYRQGAELFGRSKALFNPTCQLPPGEPCT